MSGLASRLREIMRSTGRPEGRPLHEEGRALRDQEDRPVHEDEGRRLGEEESGGRGRSSGRSIGAWDPNVVAETLGGTWAEAHGHRYLVVDRSYGAGHRHGRVAMMDCLPPWPRLPLLANPDSSDAPDARGRVLFIDLETTGLAGGAGTYAFLVGCAWFEPPSPSASAGQAGGVFRTRQFFLSSYAGERALLDGLAQLAGGIAGIISFNGKSFDLPLIETRYMYHRQQTPFSGLPHVDMLHPARRLWRSEEDEAAGVTASCRLCVLEQAVCGASREADVPGFEIPARYFNYVRSGDPRPLERVFEHNRLDLISLALLTAEASRLLDEGPAAVRTAREALGLGRLYERGGLCDLARESYRIAAGIGPAEAGPYEREAANTAVVGAGFSRPTSHDSVVGAGFSRPASHDPVVGAGFSPPPSHSTVVGAGFSRPASHDPVVGAGFSPPPSHSTVVGAGFSPPPSHSTVVGAGFSRPAFRPDPLTRAEALRCYAILCRRQRRYAEAAEGWRRILDLRRCPAHIAREATEALAVHHEHRLRDPRSARQFALRSLGFQASPSRQHATQYRLARLERKLGAPTTDALQF